MPAVPAVPARGYWSRSLCPAAERGRGGAEGSIVGFRFLGFWVETLLPRVWAMNSALLKYIITSTII